jgi:cyclase
MTAAETVLWMYLKNKINGLKFRRQHPIGVYVADFYCHKARLIIEIDGSIHSLPEIKQKDDLRQKELEGWGYEVIRFSNEQVLTQIETVLETIEKMIAKNFTQQQNTSS